MNRRLFLGNIGAAGLAAALLSRLHAPNLITRGKSRSTAINEFDLDYWGIKGANTGKANGVAIASLEAWLNDPGNPLYREKVTLRGKPGDVYLSNRDLTIRRSLVTLDLGNATWNSARRIIADGDSGVNGDRSGVLRDVWVMNGSIGTGLAGRVPARGPLFRWCEDSGAVNLVKSCRSGTSFNATCCERTWFRDCQNLHASSKGRWVIGFMLHMCNDSGVERCVISGEGRFAYGIQIKGGNRNQVVSPRIRDVTNGFPTGAAIYIRGDAPYKGSRTPELTYPFADLNWDQVDPRRESRDTLVVDAQISNAVTMNAIIVQEQARTVVRDLTARGVRNGIQVMRSGDAPAGAGHGFILDGADIEARGRGIVINAPANERRFDDNEGENPEAATARGCMEGVELRNFRAVALGRGLEGVKIERTVAAKLQNGTGCGRQGRGVSIRASCSPPVIIDVQDEC